MLTREQAMRAWDPSGRMLRAYKATASMQEVAKAFEDGSLQDVPIVGVPIEVCDYSDIAKLS
jgi:DNA ligase 4